MADHTLTRRDFMRFGICAAAGGLLAACAPQIAVQELNMRSDPISIGIIVYSQTGHTLSVARTLEQKLAALGHTASLQQIETRGEANPSDPSGELKTLPVVDGHDALVFGSPVWGGVPAWPTTHYLDTIASLRDRPAAILVTGALPAAIGRNQTIAKLTEILEAKGASVLGYGSVCWFSPRRSRQITEQIHHVSALF
jgi:hypothetical protein